jgi:hypothetical protein
LALLNDCNSATASFDLWMSKNAHDVFILVIIFLGFDWKSNMLLLVCLKLLKLQDKHWLKILLNF